MQHKHMAVPLLPLGAALMAGGLSMNVMAAEAPVATGEEQVLSTVKVEAGAEVEEKGYRATKTRVGKIEQDPHDVPQAVTNVTRDLMHDQQVGSLREALRNVSGLTFNAAEGGRSGDNMMLRGFYTFGDTYLDGMRDTAQYNRETFNLEQVDVLRGSAAMLFGRGQAGGVINQVSKLAKLEDENVVSVSGGEWSYHQLTGDFNKQLTDTAAIRLNVMDRHEETYRKNAANGDRPELERQGYALSLGLGIQTDNEFFINHVHTQTRDVPDYGVNFFNKRPINRTVAGGTIDNSDFFGGDKNFDDSDTRITTGIFTHKFSEDTQWRTQLRHGDYRRAYWAKTPNAASVPDANLGIGGNQARKLDYETLELQSDFSTKFKLAGMQHEVLTGVEFLNEDSFRQNLRNLGTTNNPLYRSSALTLRQAGVNRNMNDFNSDSYAYYIQDSIEFVPNWKILVGVRRDHMDADYTRSVGTTVNDQDIDLKYSETSYRTGLSWQPNAASHYYLSWSDSFSPTADLYQLTVTKRPPETSKTTELGAKWLFLDGDLAFRTAVYRANKYWERNTDLDAGQNETILTRKRRTDGLEFELSGRLTDNWEVFSGLALMDATILKAAPGADARIEGERPRNTPSVTFNVWTTYSFLGNWKVGGGVEAKGERTGYSPTAANQNANFCSGNWCPNTLPGYARVDAMLAYEKAKWAVRLNVKNLLDKEYYDAIYDNGAFSVPGNRRQAILATEFKF